MGAPAQELALGQGVGGLAQEGGGGWGGGLLKTWLLGQEGLLKWLVWGALLKSWLWACSRPGSWSGGLVGVAGGGCCQYCFEIHHLTEMTFNIILNEFLKIIMIVLQITNKPELN